MMMMVYRKSKPNGIFFSLSFNVKSHKILLLCVFHFLNMSQKIYNKKLRNRKLDIFLRLQKSENRIHFYIFILLEYEKSII